MTPSLMRLLLPYPLLRFPFPQIRAQRLGKAFFALGLRESSLGLRFRGHTAMFKA